MAIYLIPVYMAHIACSYIEASQSLGGYSMIIWKFPISYFCVLACFVNMLNLKDIVFGGVYDMHETSNFWACDYFTVAKSGNAMASRVLWLNELLVQATIVAKMVVCVLEWIFD